MSFYKKKTHSIWWQPLKFFSFPQMSHQYSDFPEAYRVVANQYCYINKNDNIHKNKVQQIR